MPQLAAYHVWAPLYVLVFFFFSAADGAGESVPIPMCSEVRGFAGEHNNNILVGVSVAPTEGEAIVLTVQVVSLNPSELLQQWIQLNVSYRTRGGATVFSQSNSNGIVLVDNVEAGTNIHIRVKRLLEDGPLPFRFWSYHANHPSCHIDVSAANSFIAFVPTSIGSVASPARVYFKSVAPQETKGFIVNIFGTIDATAQATTFQVMSSAEGANGTIHNSGEAVVWDSGVLYFVFASQSLAGGSSLLRVSIIWLNNITGGAENHTAEEQHAMEIQKNRTEKDMARKKTQGETRRKISFIGVLCLLFALFIVFIIVMSVVNYRLGGITEFPEMIPFISFFRLCGQYASILKERFYFGKGYRGGYHDLGRHEISTADI